MNCFQFFLFEGWQNAPGGGEAEAGGQASQHGLRGRSEEQAEAEPRDPWSQGTHQFQGNASFSIWNELFFASSLYCGTCL